MTHFSRLAFCCGLWVIMLMKKRVCREKWKGWGEGALFKAKVDFGMENKSLVKWWAETSWIAESMLSGSKEKIREPFGMS